MFKGMKKGLSFKNKYGTISLRPVKYYVDGAFAIFKVSNIIRKTACCVILCEFQLRGFFFNVMKNMKSLSRDIPISGIELLQDEGYNVTVYRVDRPLTQSELIENAKQHNALLCMFSDTIDKVFLNECKRLKIISPICCRVR